MLIPSSAARRCPIHSRHNRSPDCPHGFGRGQCKRSGFSPKSGACTPPRPTPRGPPVPRWRRPRVPGRLVVRARRFWARPGPLSPHHGPAFEPRDRKEALRILAGSSASSEDDRAEHPPVLPAGVEQDQYPVVLEVAEPKAALHPSGPFNMVMQATCTLRTPYKLSASPAAQLLTSEVLLWPTAALPCSLRSSARRRNGVTPHSPDRPQAPAGIRHPSTRGIWLIRTRRGRHPHPQASIQPRPERC